MTHTLPPMTQTPRTMTGVQMTGHGDYDKLALRHDIPVPVPLPGEVLIRVAAAGVNNTDLNTRIGWYSKGDDAGWTGQAMQFPRIQGADVCGHVVGTGAGVDPGLTGRRVLVEPCLQEAGGAALASPWYLGSEVDGGFAQYVTVAARHAYPVDSPLSDVELASFPCSYSTAENLLTRAGVATDDRVLVTGASGGVGSAVIQLARVRGATVTAVTSPSKATALRALGAARTLDRAADPVADLGPNSIDVVIDLVGGEAFPALIRVLRPKGRYAASGAIGGALVSLDLRDLYLKDLQLHGCTVLDPDVFGRLVRRIEEGRIVPLVAETYPLDRIVEAQKAFAQKAHVGKIVLRLP